MIRRLLCCTALAAFTLAGCHRAPNEPSSSAASSNYKTYQLRGKIVSINPSTSEVTVDHRAIPGFMEAMTMPYKVKDPNILGDLHSGDTITADLLVSQTSDADVSLDHIVVIAQGKPDYRPKVSYHVPAPGDAVPDFQLRNQDNRVIKLHQFRGQQLLITFIYTRCPLPNFCPLVTHNFADINRQLSGEAALRGKVHLLCVSFDPEHDTPERLRTYASTYIGSDARSGLAHWDFAVPRQKDLDQLAQWFDVGLTRQPDSTITHTLSTTLINADGKVVRFYPGNDWTVHQVVADIHESASHS